MISRRKFTKSLITFITATLIPACSRVSLRSIASEKLTYLEDLELKAPKRFQRFVKKVLKLSAYKTYGKGRNARKFSNLKEILPKAIYDLKNIKEDQLVMTDENFYTRTEKPNLLNVKTLTHISVAGLVDSPGKWRIQDIIDASKDIGVTMMECAGNDKYTGFRLMSAARWDGVLIKDLFERKPSKKSLLGFSNIKKEATHVFINGFDESSESGFNWMGVQSKAGASWIFSIDDLIKQKAFLATKMNGKPLSKDRGYPCRLIVPGWYGCASIKWVDQMIFFKPNSQTPTTKQMQEFADRTHQDGTPKLLKDYKNPDLDFTALPIKVEKWKNPQGKISYRVIGLMWGGLEDLSPKLEIEISRQNNTLKEEVHWQAKRENLLSWQIWSHWWNPKTPGRYTIKMRAPGVQSRRLDNEYYSQIVDIKEV